MKKFFKWLFKPKVLFLILLVLIGTLLFGSFAMTFGSYIFDFFSKIFDWGSTAMKWLGKILNFFGWNGMV